jgi:uncharacterized membrane protein YfcA
VLQIILIFLIAFTASLIQNTIGFGSVIILMAVLPLFLPAKVCVIVAQLGGAVLSWWMLAGRWKSIEWKKALLPIIFATLGNIVGLFFVKGISDSAYMIGLGIVLVLLSVWLLCFASRVHIRPTPVNGTVAGVVGGLMGAFFAVSAPPLVLYFSSTTEDKDNYTACLQITLAIQTTASLVGRGAMGLWPQEAWLLCIPAFLGVFLGKFPGKKIYDKLDIRTFKMLIHIFIGILGVYIFLSNC